mmetsp:Transcript_43906/g.70563  ORF Transcript_43906/g.70563 Transcript_43906/m.70563 type:complete len:223 (+) Transcript_43906:156-824(+)
MHPPAIAHEHDQRRLVLGHDGVEIVHLPEPWKHLARGDVQFALRESNQAPRVQVAPHGAAHAHLAASQRPAVILRILDLRDHSAHCRVCGAVENDPTGALMAVAEHQHHRVLPPTSLVLGRQEQTPLFRLGQAVRPVARHVARGGDLRRRRDRVGRVLQQATVRVLLADELGAKRPPISLDRGELIAGVGLCAEQNARTVSPPRAQPRRRLPAWNALRLRRR